MRTKIESTAKFNGLQIPVTEFLKVWSTWAGNKIETIPGKVGASQWNDGATAMRFKTCIHATVYSRDDYKNESVGVYEIWENQMGLTDVYFFANIEDWNQYSPNDETPNAIKQEIGLEG